VPLRPNTFLLNTVLTSLAAQASVQQPEAALRALALLREMQAYLSQILECHPDFPTTLIPAPNVLTYTIVLNVLTKAGMPEEAQKLFSTVYKLFLDGEAHLKPNLYLITPLLTAWMNPSSSSLSMGGGGSKLLLLERLEWTKQTWKQIQYLSQLGFLSALDTTIYKFMLSALAKGKDVEGAMALLEEMKPVGQQLQ